MNPWWILLNGLGWIALALVALFIAACIIVPIVTACKNARARRRQRRAVTRTVPINLTSTPSN